MTETESMDKLKGALIGLAVGDTLGIVSEFKQPGEFEIITEPRAGGVHNLPKGFWTDDTSMALCLADSLLAYGGYNSYDVMNRYWLWATKGYRSATGECFDIGGQVSSAIYSYLNTGGWVTKEEPRSSNAGNGAIMRLAPIIIAAFSNRSDEDIIKSAKYSARETHYSCEAEISTEVFATLLLKAVRANNKSDVLHFQEPGSWRRFVSFDNEVSINGKPPVKFHFNGIYEQVMKACTLDKADLNTSGYIIHSLQVAIWAFANSDSFEEGALEVVNLGGDADTNCAIYGQLAGAFYGYKGIPNKWRKVLYQEEQISQIADQLIALPGCPILLTRFEEDYTEG